MPSGALLRDPWSTGDLNAKLDPLQLKRNTAAGLAALNPLLSPGEPAIEIDTHKGKLGDGVTRYNALPYSIGVVGSALSLPADSVAVNNTGSTGPAVGLDKASFRTFADVPSKINDFTPLSTAYAAHAADVAGQVSTLPVVLTTGSPTVSVTTALPAGISQGQPIWGTGIPDYSYVFNIAANRLSFQLSSNPLVYNAANAQAPGGSITANWLVTAAGAHGIVWGAYPYVNPINLHTLGRSSSINLPATLATRSTWEESWIKGEKWMHSFENPTPQRIFPLQPSIASHIVAPVPSAFQVWSPFPTTTAWDFLEPNSTNVGRYKLYAPLENATQARIVIDTLPTAATAGSGAKLKAQYWTGSAWTDLAENSPASTIEVAIDNGAGAKVGTWGVIDNAAVAQAATANDFLWFRVVGLAASAAGSPSFGTVRLQFQ